MAQKMAVEAHPETRPLPTVVFVGLREPEYVRNAVILRSLRMSGRRVEVVSSRARNYPMRIAQTLARLLPLLWRSQKKRIFIAAFLGQPLAILLHAMRRRPIILDAFVSIFDTVCNDRQMAKPGSLVGRFLKAADRRAFQYADLILVDTAAQGRFLQETFGVADTKIHVLRVGADETIFQPAAKGRVHATSVFYYSSGLPLHGLPVVLEAARLLNDEGITFRIAGLKPGPDLPRNVSALGWVPERNIASLVQDADLCLAGHFAINRKSQRVVPGKAYQFTASRKATVLTFGEGNTEVYTPGLDAFFCNPGSPKELADLIRAALADPEMLDRIAEAGRRTFEQVAGADVLAVKIGEVVQSCVSLAK